MDSYLKGLYRAVFNIHPLGDRQCFLNKKRTSSIVFEIFCLQDYNDIPGVTQKFQTIWLKTNVVLLKNDIVL